MDTIFIFTFNQHSFRRFLSSISFAAETFGCRSRSKDLGARSPSKKASRFPVLLGVTSDAAVGRRASLAITCPGRAKDACSSPSLCPGSDDKTLQPGTGSMLPLLGRSDRGRTDQAYAVISRFQF